jgi:hypothetical protein
MKVRKLIEQLMLLDPNTTVTIPGYEGGVTEVKKLREIRVKKNVNPESYYGEHKEDELGKAKVILITGRR